MSSSVEYVELLKTRGKKNLCNKPFKYNRAEHQCNIYISSCTVRFYLCLVLLQALLCSSKLKNMTHVFQLGFLSHLIAFLSFNGDNVKKQRLQTNNAKHSIY